MEVIGHHFQGYWNAQRYILTSEGNPEARPVREMPVKSVIASPRAGATVGLEKQTLFGFAWSGYGCITRVEVSTDGGATWSDARLIQDGGPLAWTRWQYEWTPQAAGPALLASRATDERGNLQPSEATWNTFGYQMNAIEIRQLIVNERP
jgi:hypothetical protein